MFNRVNFRVETLITICLVVIIGMVLLLSWVSAKKLARDKMRVSDITQIQEGLKLYFSQNGYYPTGQGTIAPRGLSDYMDHWPTAPLPPDGNCTVSNNDYNYSQKSLGLDFTLTFCLGQDVGDLSSGPHTATTKGVQ
jgi:type II secretory pathway pseudopilin PulG